MKTNPETTLTQDEKDIVRLIAENENLFFQTRSQYTKLCTIIRKLAAKQDLEKEVMKP